MTHSSACLTFSTLASDSLCYHWKNQTRYLITILQQQHSSAIIAIDITNYHSHTLVSLFVSLTDSFTLIHSFIADNLNRHHHFISWQPNQLEQTSWLRVEVGQDGNLPLHHHLQPREQDLWVTMKITCRPVNLSLVLSR